ncbi:MAG: hypothetical protein FJZ00_05215, partial [Candidatus Sericytochromatia bacterium]|nr:hypothetical protein [Candidatus Tanganyikabacteria bacterium]
MTSESCLRCGEAIAEPARFCSACGAAAGARCIVCNSPADRGQALCATCRQTMADGQSPYRLHAKPDDSPIQGERRVVTVLIADLDDYQTALMGLDPEEAGRLLGEALQALIAAVHRYGGAVQRSAGDRLLARFGAP